MIPYNIEVYWNEEYQEESKVFLEGFIPISVVEINYIDDGNYPLKLVYTSPSFNNENIEKFGAVFVYEINKNFIPSNDD
jgi:hypothetical protein